MTKIAIETTYSAFGTTVIDLPEGKTWADVAHYYIKWGRLHINFKGTPKDDYQEFQLDDVAMESDNYKRPDQTMIWSVAADGEPDYDAEALAKQE